MRKIAGNDDLMTTRQAGEALGVAVRTVQLWVESGVLPAWRTAGGHRRIARSAVEKLMAERAQVIGHGTSEAQDKAATRPLQLLVVEDDPDVMKLFELVVGYWNFPVALSKAGNGFEGLLRMGELRPDMVVTDLMMPGMDGFEMVRAIRKPDSGLRDLSLIVVTALTPADIEERGGLPAGVQVFQKPVPFEEIETLARKLHQKPKGRPRKAAA